MKRSLRWTLPLLLLSAVALAAGPISMSFRGPLKDALKDIADKGDLNLVIQGDFSEPVEVYLKDVSAEEALRATAQAHGLAVHQSGRIFTLSRMTPEEREAAEDEVEAADSEADENIAVPDTDGEIHETKKGDRVTTGPLRVNEGEVIQGDAVAFGGPVEILGTVMGDVVAFGGGVHLGPRSEVKGEVVTFGGELVKDSGAKVQGEAFSVGAHTWRSFFHGKSPETPEGSSPILWVASRLLQFAVLFGIGFLFLLFAPNRMKEIRRDMRDSPMASFFVGLVGLFGILILSTLMFVTLIGIPLGLGLLLLLTLALAAGISAAAYEVGDRIPLGARKSQALVMAVGALLVTIGVSIPWLGPVVLAILLFVGLGALLRTRFGSTRKALSTPPPPAPV